MKRFTEYDCDWEYQLLEEDLPEAIEKLGKLEDLLANYNIESVEKLDQMLKANKEVEVLKKALKLACKEHNEIGYCFKEGQCENYDYGFKCIKCLEEHFKSQAEKKLSCEKSKE